MRLLERAALVAAEVVKALQPFLPCCFGHHRTESVLRLRDVYRGKGARSRGEKQAKDLSVVHQVRCRRERLEAWRGEGEPQTTAHS